MSGTAVALIYGSGSRRVKEKAIVDLALFLSVLVFVVLLIFRELSIPKLLFFIIATAILLVIRRQIR